MTDYSYEQEELKRQEDEDYRQRQKLLYEEDQKRIEQQRLEEEERNNQERREVEERREAEERLRLEQIENEEREAYEQKIKEDLLAAQKVDARINAQLKEDEARRAQEQEARSKDLESKNNLKLHENHAHENTQKPLDRNVLRFEPRPRKQRIHEARGRNLEWHMRYQNSQRRLELQDALRNKPEELEQKLQEWRQVELEQLQNEVEPFDFDKFLADYDQENAYRKANPVEDPIFQNIDEDYNKIISFDDWKVATGLAPSPTDYVDLRQDSVLVKEEEEHKYSSVTDERAFLKDAEQYKLDTIDPHIVNGQLKAYYIIDGQLYGIPDIAENKALLERFLQYEQKQHDEYERTIHMEAEKVDEIATPHGAVISQDSSFKDLVDLKVELFDASSEAARQGHFDDVKDFHIKITACDRWISQVIEKHPELARLVERGFPHPEYASYDQAARDRMQQIDEYEEHLYEKALDISEINRLDGNPITRDSARSEISNLKVELDKEIFRTKDSQQLEDLYTKSLALNEWLLESDAKLPDSVLPFENNHHREHTELLECLVRRGAFDKWLDEKNLIQDRTVSEALDLNQIGSTDKMDVHKVLGWQTQERDDSGLARIEATENPTMSITRTSMFSGVTHIQELPVTEEQLRLWQEGVLIQDAMPQLTVSQREFLMTGITEEEWGEFEKSIEIAESRDFQDEIDQSDHLENISNQYWQEAHDEYLEEFNFEPAKDLETCSSIGSLFGLEKKTQELDRDEQSSEDHQSKSKSKSFFDKAEEDKYTEDSYGRRFLKPELIRKTPIAPVPAWASNNEDFDMGEFLGNRLDDIQECMAAERIKEMVRNDGTIVTPQSGFADLLTLREELLLNRSNLDSSIYSPDNKQRIKEIALREWIEAHEEGRSLDFGLGQHTSTQYRDGEVFIEEFNFDKDTPSEPDESVGNVLGFEVKEIHRFRHGVDSESKFQEFNNRRNQEKLVEHERDEDEFARGR